MRRRHGRGEECEGPARGAAWPRSIGRPASAASTAWKIPGGVHCCVSSTLPGELAFRAVRLGADRHINVLILIVESVFIPPAFRGAPTSKCTHLVEFTDV